MSTNDALLTLSTRLYQAQWKTDRQYHRLRAYLEAQRNVIDEVSLFDEDFPCRAGTPLEELAPVLAQLAERMDDIRTLGFASVGINVLATLGHGDEAGDIFKASSLPPMVGHDGRASLTCVCPNSPEFIDYTHRRYVLTAAARPDFIWIDDDLRPSNHGFAQYPCFCETCLSGFGEARGRENLMAALNAPENAALRAGWSRFWGESIRNVCELCRDAIASVDPAIQLGAMLVGPSLSTYGNYPIAAWLEALAADRVRPGHGYYTDETPRQMLTKAMDVAHMTEHFPNNTADIQYELENWPYIPLDKSRATVLNEGTLAIMSGCTGVAFNMTKACLGDLDEHLPLAGALEACRDKWTALVRAARGSELRGLWPAFSLASMANREVDETGWFHESPPHDPHVPNVLLEMGLPLTPTRDGACGILLSGRMAEAFDDEALRSMLKGGVILDSEALRVLWHRGLGEFAGVRPGDPGLTAVQEQLTDHPFNGEWAGDERRVVTTPADNACVLEPVADGVETLSSLIPFGGKALGPCCTRYENALGGRIFVSSYIPWRHLGSAAKRSQLHAVVDWLSQGQLPVRVRELVRVAPWIRTKANGEIACIVLMNMAFDASGPLTLEMRGPSRPLRLLNGDAREPLSTTEEGDKLLLHVPSVAPWSTAIIV